MFHICVFTFLEDRTIQPGFRLCKALLSCVLSFEKDLTVHGRAGYVKFCKL